MLHVLWIGCAFPVTALLTVFLLTATPYARYRRPSAFGITLACSAPAGIWAGLVVPAWDMFGLIIAVLTIVLCLWLIRISVPRRLAVAALLIGILAASTAFTLMIVQLFFEEYSIHVLPDVLRGSFCFVTASVYSFVLVALMAVMRRHASYRERGDQAIAGCLALVMLTVSLCISAFQTGIRMNVVPFSIGFIGLILSYGALAYFYGKFIYRQTKREAQLNAMESELAESRREFELSSAELLGVRRVRHDLNNHLMVLENLLAEGRRSEAAAYLKNLKDSFRTRIAGAEDTWTATKATELLGRGISFTCAYAQGDDIGVSAVAGECIRTATAILEKLLAGRQDATLRIDGTDGTLTMTASPCTLDEVRSAFSASPLSFDKCCVMLGEPRHGEVRIAIDLRRRVDCMKNEPAAPRYALPQ